MGGKESNCYSLCSFCLLVSALLNIYLLKESYFDKNQKLSWSEEAAAEAEAVAAIDCSGHGRAYVDGVIGGDDKPVCECNSCYGGDDCSIFLPACPADANSGDPLFLEPFWMHHATRSAVLVSGWHRMSYNFPGITFISQELENHIRLIHGVARNAITDGKHIVFGVGSTQLLNAAVYALSVNLSSHASVLAAIPAYPLYETQTNFFENKNYEFEGGVSVVNNSLCAETNIIEFVTSPNNPDGNLREAVCEGDNVRVIYDRAYYWPHFTAIPSPADEDVMIFTMSKLSGHAGSRFGYEPISFLHDFCTYYYRYNLLFFTNFDVSVYAWSNRWAFVKDKEIYENMLTYISFAEMGISRETQLRSLQLMKAILHGDGREIFSYSFDKMSDRWRNLSRIFSSSRRFSVQEIPPLYCNFFDKVREPSPGYAWVKCEKEEDTNCAAVLLAANIIGREGWRFGVGDRYVRLSLLKGDDDFNLLLDHLEKLIDTEEEAKELSNF